MFIPDIIASDARHSKASMRSFCAAHNVIGKWETLIASLVTREENTTDKQIVVCVAWELPFSPTDRQMSTMTGPTPLTLDEGADYCVHPVDGK